MFKLYNKVGPRANQKLLPRLLRINSLHPRKGRVQKDGEGRAKSQLSCQSWDSLRMGDGSICMDQVGCFWAGLLFGPATEYAYFV